MNRKNALLTAVDQIRGALLLIEEHAEPPHMKGYKFEKQFCSMCIDRGIDVRPGDGQHVDVFANGMRVQCKNVTPDFRGIVYVQPGQSTYYYESDFDVLAMYAGGDLYIVPMEFIPKTRGHVSIQLNVGGLSRWIEAWSVFSGLNPPEKQMTFIPLWRAENGR